MADKGKNVSYPAAQIDEGLRRALEHGLGAASAVCDDCNDAVANGWYYTYGATANKPSGLNGVFLVMHRTANEIVQIYWCAGYYDGFCVRSRVGGVWGVWGWYNPPMLLGVEYRTLERYLGKPVYAKAVNFGALPNAAQATVAHGISNLEHCIELNGSAGVYNLIGMSGVSKAFCGSTVIAITTTENLSTSSAVVRLKYTKTTD